MHFDRFDICEAYYMYDVLWGPTPYGARLRRVQFKPSCLLDLDSLTENAKEIYGALVRRQQRAMLCGQSVRFPIARSRFLGGLTIRMEMLILGP